MTNVSMVTSVKPAFLSTLLLNTTNTTFVNVITKDPSYSHVDKGQTGKCHDWEDAQHTLFQLANLCLAISFLTPSSFKFHVFFLRCLLLIGFLFFVLWAGLFVCMADVLGWNTVFFTVNLCHIGYLAFLHFPVRMHDQLEEVYSKLFKPLKMSRKEFSEMCKIGTVITIPKGSIYAMEGITRCADKVSILIKGRLKVTYGRFFLHHIETNHFVNSPEVDAATVNVETEEKYQVTISASEDGSILTWHYPALREYLDTNPFLSTAFHFIIGKDISHKLYQIQELLLANPDYMRTLASRQSSMVNLRNSLVPQDSCLSLSRLNSFNTAGPQALEVAQAVRQLSPMTIETSV